MKLELYGIHCLLVWLMIAVSAMAQTAPLTETEVRAFIAALDQAIQQRDIDAIEAALAPEVVIHFEIESEQGNESLQFSRDEYIASLKTIMAELRDYQAQVQIRTVKIIGEGESAEVRLQVWERLVWADKQQESIASENLLLRRGEAGLLVELIIGRVRIAEPLQNISLGGSV